MNKSQKIKTLGDRICLDKRQIIELLHEFTVGVNSAEEVKPFLDRHFGKLRNLDQGFNGGKQ